MMISIYRVHSLETNRAEPTSRQILVLSEHKLKRKVICNTPYCTVRAWAMPALWLYIFYDFSAGLGSGSPLDPSMESLLLGEISKSFS